MKFVTVFRTFNPAEAQLIRSRLEASGFLAQVKNELSSLSMEGYSMAVGGLHVQVPDDQAQEAEALVNSANETPE